MPTAVGFPVDPYRGRTPGIGGSPDARGRFTNSEQPSREELYRTQYLRNRDSARSLVVSWAGIQTRLLLDHRTFF